LYFPLTLTFSRGERGYLTIDHFLLPLGEGQDEGILKIFLFYVTLIPDGRRRKEFSLLFSSFSPREKVRMRGAGHFMFAVIFAENHSGMAKKRYRDLI